MQLIASVFHIFTFCCLMFDVTFELAFWFNGYRKIVPPEDRLTTNSFLS